MTASTATDAPRGMSFLLSRNRLNVAVSRAKWCAIVVRSRTFTHYLPPTPTALAELGAFLRLAPEPAGDRDRESPGQPKHIPSPR